MNAAIVEARALLSRAIEILATLPEPAEPDEYVDQGDAARFGLSSRAYLEAARRGDFPAAAIGKKRRAKVVDVETWLSSRRVTPRPRPAPGVDPIDHALDLAAARISKRTNRRVSP